MMGGSYELGGVLPAYRARVRVRECVGKHNQPQFLISFEKLELQKPTEKILANATQHNKPVRRFAITIVAF